MLSIATRLALALMMLTAIPAFAQEEADDAAAAEEVVETETTTMSEPEVVYSTPETDYSNANVWWGNRSVSYGNYIRFERIAMAQAPAAMGPPSVGPIYFDDNKKAVLRPEAAAELNKAVAYLNANPNGIVVLQNQTGGPGGRSEQAIRNYLIEHGIAESRITTDAGATGVAVVIPYSVLGS